MVETCMGTYAYRHSSSCLDLWMLAHWKCARCRAWAAAQSWHDASLNSPLLNVCQQWWKVAIIELYLLFWSSTAGLHSVLAYTRQFWCDVKPSQSTCCHPCRCQGKPMPQPSLFGIGFMLKCADMQLAVNSHFPTFNAIHGNVADFSGTFPKVFQDFSKGFPEDKCKTFGKGWKTSGKGERIRTFECRIQIPVPYLLSTPQWLSETFK